MKINYLSIRKNVWKAALWLAIPASMTFFSCKEDIDESNLYTSTEETIEDYLRNRPEQFSSFNYILERIGYDKIMSAYGNYTCFAPDNKAVESYIDSLFNDTVDVTDWKVDGNIIHGHNGMIAKGLEGLNDSLCRDIALIHMTSTPYLSVDLKGENLPTMLLRDINTFTDPISGKIMLNVYSAITNPDNELLNGVVHEIDHVITRSNNLVLGELEKHPNLSLFTKAIKACGLEDSLSVQKREGIRSSKSMPSGTGKGAGDVYIPQECLVGFTIFAENNDVLKRNGISTLEDLAEYANKVYEKCADTKDDAKREGWYDYYRNNGIQVSTGTDYESPYNALNMFIRYHIVKYKVPYSRLVNSYNEVSKVQLYEYYETMLPYTLLKVQGRANSNLYVNRWESNTSLTDVVGELGSSDIIKVKDNGRLVYSDNIAALNGYIHPIGDMLVYDYDVPNGVLNERMRFDDISLLPEMMTNGLRRISAAEVKSRNGKASGSFGGDDAVRLPINYCENLVVYNDDNTELYYLPGQSVSWSNYQGDELLCMGPYDFALRLPPVPDGMYELRMGYTANGNRGMVQIYLGTSSDLNSMQTLDIPVDMRNTPVNNQDGSPDINTGWCDWEKTDDSGVETDASMHNLGWMRGPLYYTVGPGGTIARSNTEDLRRVITKRQFKQGDNWLRFKTVLPKLKSTEFHLDYIEFCPASVYNNDQYAEDMY